MGVPANQRGPYRPMRFEATIEDCIVEGELPDGLEGGFYRNGPTWRRPNKQGLETVYTIDGMVQGLVFRDGKVEFRNRWVRTPKFVAEERAGRSLSGRQGRVPQPLGAHAEVRRRGACGPVVVLLCRWQIR